MSGTTLQRHAFTSATSDNLFHALLDDIYLSTTIEGRVGIYSVAKDTVTIADIIVLDHLCPGGLTTVSSLIIKIDPTEAKSDACSLFKYIRRLLDKGMIEKAVKAGLGKYTEMSITSFLESYFRQTPHPSLTLISSPAPFPPILVARLTVIHLAAASAPIVLPVAIHTLNRHGWLIGDLVWVEEGTEPGVRGHRNERYGGIIDSFASTRAAQR
jgi:hypothetical protein